VLASVGAAGGAAAAYAATVIDASSFTQLPAALQASAAGSIVFTDPGYQYADATELASDFGTPSLII